MVFKKTQQNDGEYIDQNGVRYSLEASRRRRSSNGINVGFTEFPDAETALEFWGLTLAPPPELEESTPATELENPDIIDV